MGQFTAGKAILPHLKHDGLDLSLFCLTAFGLVLERRSASIITSIQLIVQQANVLRILENPSLGGPSSKDILFEDLGISANRVCGAQKTHHLLDQALRMFSCWTLSCWTKNCITKINRNIFKVCHWAAGPAGRFQRGILCGWLPHKGRPPEHGWPSGHPTGQSLKLPIAQETRASCRQIGV